MHTEVDNGITYIILCVNIIFTGDYNFYFKHRRETFKMSIDNGIVCCILQPVDQWSVTNVLEWMASVNLYRYVEIFKLHNVTGEDLGCLNDDKLMVGRTLNELPGSLEFVYRFPC